jgi:hypothetical protein
MWSDSTRTDADRDTTALAPPLVWTPPSAAEIDAAFSPNRATISDSASSFDARIARALRSNDLAPPRNVQHPAGSTLSNPIPWDSINDAARTKYDDDDDDEDEDEDEEDGDDRRGRSVVSRTHAPLGRECNSYNLRRYSITTMHRPMESSSSHNSVDSQDARFCISSSTRSLSSAVDVPLSNSSRLRWERIPPPSSSARNLLLLAMAPPRLVVVVVAVGKEAEDANPSNATMAFSRRVDIGTLDASLEFSYRSVGVVVVVAFEPLLFPPPLATEKPCCRAEDDADRDAS